MSIKVPENHLGNCAYNISAFCTIYVGLHKRCADRYIIMLEGCWKMKNKTINVHFYVS